MMTDDQIDELIREATWRAQWEASLNEVQAQHISNIMGDLVDSILTGKNIVLFAYQEEEVNDAIRH